MTLIEKALHLAGRGRDLANRLAFLGPLAVRITVGVVFMGTGWGKLHNIDGVTSFFTDLGIPMPGLNARVAASTEFLGGLFVLLGLATRLVSVPLAFTMVVAILTDKWKEFSGFREFLGLEETSYLAMFVWLAFAGGGKASLDALFARITGRRRPPTGPLASPGKVSATSVAS